MLSGGNSCAEHEGQGRAEHRVRCQAHLRAGNSKLLESLSQPRQAALGRDREEQQSQEHQSGRGVLVLSQHLCGAGEHWDVWE